MRHPLQRSCGGVLRARGHVQAGPFQNSGVQETDTLFEGDTVRLAFRGPLMTVLAVKADRCCCFWIDERGRLAHGEFEREVVELVRPAERLIPNSDPFWQVRSSSAAAT